ncbi:MAG: aminotransferase class V-fold PLP-dependent enzyme [Promethearchaeota archaeon]|nr:MAG: aminotransferase class V-fold PLP-dependent enzyme [Candidatus Lokiarchaeota archaeon]
MSIDWNQIRKEQFPALEISVYLKAAGGSPMSTAAYKAGINYFNEMHLEGDNYWEKYLLELDEARALVAEYINSNVEEIGFLTNTSSGMNVIARIIEKGGIIYPEQEFPSSIHIFKSLGFNTIKIKARNDNMYQINSFENFIKQTSRYSIHSHVQYLTGFRQDLNELGEFCIRHKILNILNATQSFGAFPIDVKNQHIDMLVASGLKWACCGYGIGILFIKKRFIDEINLPFSSWLSVKDAFSMDNDNLNIIKQVKSMDGLGGTPNFPALLALKGGLTLLKTIGNGNIQTGVMRINKRIMALVYEFISQIQNLNFKIITPLDLNHLSGIITIEDKRAESIYKKLLSKNILISLRNYPKSPEKTLLRFAFNYYNNFEDIEQVIKVLKKII